MRNDVPSAANSVSSSHSSGSSGSAAGRARAQDNRSTSGEPAAALPQALQELLPQAAVLLTAGEPSWLWIACAMDVRCS